MRKDFKDFRDSVVYKESRGLRDRKVSLDPLDRLESRDRKVFRDPQVSREPRDPKVQQVRKEAEAFRDRQVSRGLRAVKVWPAVRVSRA